MKKTASNILGMTAGLMILASGQAHAADLNKGGKGYDAGASYSSAAWEGLYAGLSINGGASTIIIEKTGKDFGLDEGYGGLGGFAGYNFVSGSWVYGVEADIGSTATKKNKTDDDFGKISASSGMVGSLRARGGYAWDNVLLYGTVGVAFSDNEIKGDQLKDNGGLDVGLALGVGAEWAFSDKWTARLEGMSYGFGEKDLKIDDDKFDAGVGISTVKLGLARRF